MGATTGRRSLIAFLAVTLALGAAGCSSDSGGGGTRALTLYTCASENVEQAVIAAFEKQHAGTKVTVFRAPTAELNARVAADTRSGGIRADVIWACDPLTMHGYDKQGLLRRWSPPNAADIPGKYRTADFTGVDILYMIVAVHQGVPPPASWADLAAAQYSGKVVLPNPSFAASALGALGYLASTPGYGIGYYHRLKRNGAVQVDAPSDALTGVEQGQYGAAMTLADAAYADKDKGSPISVVWPKPGGVAIYAPIGVTSKSHPSPMAEQFAAFAASRDGQKLMAEQGDYVTLPGLGGPPLPADAATVSPDWPKLFDRYRSMLSDYVAIFGR